MKHHIQGLNKLEDVLNHYFKINRNEELSYSKIASLINVNNREALKDLWKEHERIRKGHVHLDHYEGSQIKPFFSYLDLKIALTEKLFKKCVFCERKCKVNRHQEQGFCDVQETKISSEFLHRGEERPLVPSNTIFFTGCTFKCVYCQNWDISQHPNLGLPVSEQKMAEIIDSRRSEGSRNVNFVGGDPNPHLLYILKTILLIKQNLPVVWNSNFYMSREAMCILEGVVDLYLTDFKYGNDQCALRLSNIPNYWKVVARNHEQAWQSADMIIRHLVLPNHVECCTKPILDWIYDNMGKNVVLNIMAQYRPVFHAAEYEDISRFLYNQEYQEAVNYARRLGFTNLI